MTAMRILLYLKSGDSLGPYTHFNCLYSLHECFIAHMLPDRPAERLNQTQ